MRKEICFHRFLYWVFHRRATAVSLSFSFATRRCSNAKHSSSKWRNTERNQTRVLTKIIPQVSLLVNNRECSWTNNLIYSLIAMKTAIPYITYSFSLSADFSKGKFTHRIAPLALVLGHMLWILCKYVWGESALPNSSMALPFSPEKFSTIRDVINSYLFAVFQWVRCSINI